MSSVLDELVDSLELAPKESEAESNSHASLLSLDVGTSGVRAALFDDRGNELQSVKISRSTSSHTSFNELDPNERVDEVIRAIDHIVASATGNIELIAISAFWHSLMGIDSSGTPTI